MNTDQYFADPRRTHRLYRDTRRGMIFGVCAGIADYFAFDLRVTRVLTVLGAMFAFPLVCVSYVVLGAHVAAQARGVGRLRSACRDKFVPIRTTCCRACAIDFAISIRACSGSRNT